MDVYSLVVQAEYRLLIISIQYMIVSMDMKVPSTKFSSRTQFLSFNE